MLQRHKVPTIFNIYMLDVICCALGCVILLWQVAHQEAEMQTAEAKTKGDEAVQAKQDYEKSKLDLLLASNDVNSEKAISEPNDGSDAPPDGTIAPENARSR